MLGGKPPFVLGGLEPSGVSNTICYLASSHFTKGAPVQYTSVHYELV